ncbi:hypothetical protein ABFA07_002610 [Porites harrisoni]
METEEDENINKPRQIDNLTQQATCENESTNNYGFLPHLLS